MVADRPKPEEIIPKIIDMINASDLGRFNSNRFDISLLAEELLRVSFHFALSKHKLIDIQTIFHKMKPRNLSSAYRFYCGKSLENTHSAEADILAIFEILDLQANKYDELGDDAHSLSEFSFHKRSTDLTRFFIYNDKEEDMFSFGKYKNQKVLGVFDKDSVYFIWMQNEYFPLYTHKILTAIKLKSKF